MSASFKLADEGVLGSDLFVGLHGADRHYFLNLPAHHVIQAAFFTAFGPGLAQARAPSLVAGVVALCAVGWLAFKWGGLGCSVAAGILLLFWRSNMIAADPRPPLLALAQSGRYDVMVLSLWWLTILMLQQHLDEPRRTMAIIAGLLAGTTALTQFYGVGVLACLALALLWAKRQDKQRTLYAREVAIGAMSPIVIYVTYVVAHWMDFTGQAMLRSDRLRFHDPRFYGTNLLNEWHRFEWLVKAPLDIVGAWAVVAAIPLTFLAFTRLLRRGYLWGPMSALAACLSLALLDSIKARIYASLLVPALSVGLAMALVPSGLKSRRAPLNALRTLAGGVFLLAIVLDGLGGYRFVAYEGPRVSPYSKVGQQIETSLEPQLSVLGSPRWWWALRTHPYRSLNAHWEIWEAEERANHKPDFGAMLDGFRGAYLILDDDIRGDLSRVPSRLQQQVHEVLASRASMVAAWRDPTYGYIEIYRF